jgi:serine/threonine-protein kinase RsbW
VGRFSADFALDDLARVRAIVQEAAIAASFGDRCDDLVLAVNELATNAIRHGGGRGRLTIEYATGAMTVEVRDWGSGVTSAGAGLLPDVTVPGGRGL